MKEQSQWIAAHSFFSARQQQLTELESIRTGMLFLPPMPQKQHVLLQWVRKIPLLTGFGNNIAGAGFAILGIEAALRFPSDKIQSWSNRFQMIALGLALIDFIRVPAIYLTAWLLGERVPVSTAKNARWLQAAILLSFAVMALVFPATAGPTGLIGALLGFGVSFLNLGRFFYRKYQLAKQLRQSCSECERAITALIALQNQAIGIRQRLLAGIRQRDEAEVQRLSRRASGILAQLNRQKSLVQARWSTQCCLGQMQVKSGFVELMDKSVGVALASLGLLGTVMNLFFPLAGLMILAGTALAGTTYISFRITYPWLKSKWTNTSLERCRQTEENTKGEAVENSETPESTIKIFQVLTPMGLKASESKNTAQIIKKLPWRIQVQNSVLSLCPEPADQSELISCPARSSPLPRQASLYEV